MRVLSQSSRLRKSKVEQQNNFKPNRNDPLIQKLLENQAIQFGGNQTQQAGFDYNKYLREGETRIQNNNKNQINRRNGANSEMEGLLPTMGHSGDYTQNHQQQVHTSLGLANMSNSNKGSG